MDVEFWLILICIAVFWWAVGQVAAYFKNRQVAKIQKIRAAREEIEQARKELEATRMRNERDREAIEILAQEKSRGFPWLAQAYADYSQLQQAKEADYMERKSHPARVSAERVREIARERRIVEEKLRIAQGVMKYYQSLVPFLEEFLGDVDEEILKKVLSRNVQEPIREMDELGVDPVRTYLSSLSHEEYQQLSSAERNQLALDRYWAGRKSKWQIGRDYERYIGYIYEADGYSVYYKGILEGFDDLGRDLICTKGQETIIIQCKRWAQHKTIHEKHINQLYGTVIRYKIDHPDETVGAVLYTTTKFSDRAKEFADRLGVGIGEEYPFREYPSIKCNVSRKDGARIYHLPFDQQYDRTLVEEERNECYVETIQKAENLGFRRAWKWRGNEQD